MNRNELLDHIEHQFGYGCRKICEERARQKEVKGYDLERDKNFYQNEELAAASVAYGMDPSSFKGSRKVIWPWSLEYWNPSPHNRIREFEKSGALMAAQIEVTHFQNQKERVKKGYPARPPKGPDRPVG